MDDVKKICPHCGAELKDGATFCPHCGSDKDTGWKEGAESADLELPDYDEIIENEMNEKLNKVLRIWPKEKKFFSDCVGNYRRNFSRRFVNRVYRDRLNTKIHSI